MKILICDDDSEDSLLEKNIILASWGKFKDLYSHETREPPEFEFIRDVKDVLKAIDDYSPDVVLFDLIYPCSGAEETLKNILPRVVLTGVAIIVVSGSPDRELMLKATDLGATDFISKSEMWLGLENSLIYKSIVRSWRESECMKQILLAAKAINNVISHNSDEKN